MDDKLELTPELMIDVINSRGELIEKLRVELERLKRYEMMVWYIANDYHELSHDKAKWQRDDWKKRCQKLMAEDTDDAPLGHTEHELKDLEF